MEEKKPVTIVIPETVNFADLGLRRVKGSMELSWIPIEAICEANKLDIQVFQNGPEDNVAALITAWYGEHRQRGGAPDPVMEEYWDEMGFEDAAPLN